MEEQNNAPEKVMLHETVQSLDHLSEQDRVVYTKDPVSGSYNLLPSVRDAMNAKTKALQNERALNSHLKSQLKAKEEMPTPVQQQPEPQVQQPAPKAELAQQHNTDQIEQIMKSQKEMMEAMQRRDTAAKKTAIDAFISNASAKYGANEHFAKIIKDNLDAKETESGYQVVIKNEQGAERYGYDGMSPLTMDEFMQEYRNNPSYSVFFKSAGASGAGANISNKITPHNAGKMFQEDMSGEQLEQLLSQPGGREAYKMMPRRAKHCNSR